MEENWSFFSLFLKYGFSLDDDAHVFDKHATCKDA